MGSTRTESGCAEGARQPAPCAAPRQPRRRCLAPDFGRKGRQVGRQGRGCPSAGGCSAPWLPRCTPAVPTPGETSSGLARRACAPVSPHDKQSGTSYTHSANTFFFCLFDSDCQGIWQLRAISWSLPVPGGRGYWAWKRGRSRPRTARGACMVLLQPTGHGRTCSQTGVLSASQGKRQGEKGRLQKIKTIVIIKAGRSGFHLQLKMLHASSLEKRPIKCGRPEKRRRRRKGRGEQGKGRGRPER